MAEDYSIQQKQPSSTPYFVAGATIGGLGAGINTNVITCSTHIHPFKSIHIQKLCKN